MALNAFSVRQQSENEAVTFLRILIKKTECFLNSLLGMSSWTGKKQFKKYLK